jgi:hypothetical protein
MITSYRRSLCIAADAHASVVHSHLPDRIGFHYDKYKELVQLMVFMGHRQLSSRYAGALWRNMMLGYYTKISIDVGVKCSVEMLAFIRRDMVKFSVGINQDTMMSTAAANRDEYRRVREMYHSSPSGPSEPPCGGTNWENGCGGCDDCTGQLSSNHARLFNEYPYRFCARDDRSDGVIPTCITLRCGDAVKKCKACKCSSGQVVRHCSVDFCRCSHPEIPAVTSFIGGALPEICDCWRCEPTSKESKLFVLLKRLDLMDSLAMGGFVGDVMGMVTQYLI